MPILKALAGLVGGILLILGVLTAICLIGITLIWASLPLLEFASE